MVQRERWTEMSRVETALLAQGMFSGGKGEEVFKAVQGLTKELKSRVFHHGFSSRRLADKLRQELHEMQAAQLRLKKLAAMTV